MQKTRTVRGFSEDQREEKNHERHAVLFDRDGEKKNHFREEPKQ
jgi:hypothetical protein